jgi:hypothetical protein
MSKYTVILAAVGTVVTLPPLLDESGDSAWTYPGYMVVEEVSITPLDYGDPISWSGDRDRIPCQMFFVQEDDEEFWRVVMVFCDKVVVLQEGEEVREIPLTCIPEGVVYSKGGSYALVIGNCDNLPYDELVNLDSGRTTPYLVRLENSTGQDGNYARDYIYLCDNGSIIRDTYPNDHRTDSRRIQVIDSEMNVLVDLDEAEIRAWQNTRSTIISTQRPTIEISVGNSVYLISDTTDSRSYTAAFTLDGDKLWERHDYRFSRITSDDRYIIAFDFPDIILADAQTGETLYRYSIERDGRFGASIISRTGHSWAANIRLDWEHTEGRLRPYEGVLVWGTEPSDSHDIIELVYPADNWDDILPYQISEGGHILGSSVGLPGSGHSHYTHKIVYVNRNGIILWISPLVSYDRLDMSFSVAQRNLNREYELGLWPMAMQSDGQRFGYFDGSSLKFFRIEQF